MIHRTESDRQALRRLLATERDSTLRQIASLEREFDSIGEASADVATDDEHDPEGTTIAFERAQVAALVERARARLTNSTMRWSGWTPVPTASAIGAAHRSRGNGSPPGPWHARAWRAPRRRGAGGPARPDASVRGIPDRSPTKPRS
jgi:hypothetical protein